MAGRIQLRRGTAANWTSANPTLAAGEVGVETDTGYAKVGNGSTAWTSLGYVDARAAALLTAHLADTSDAHDASAISFSATGNIAATDVQAAIAELDTEKAAVAEPIAAAHIADTADAHDASAISVLDTAGNWTATDVEAVLAELPTKFAPLDSQLFVPAWLFTATSGEAVYDASLRRTPSISMKIDSIITSLVALPSHWATARAYVLWANNTSGSGNVSWYLYNSQFDAGDSITQPTSNGGIVTTTAPAQYATAESLAWSPMTVNTKPYMILNVLRSGTSDTFGTGYVEFLGLLIERVS